MVLCSDCFSLPPPTALACFATLHAGLSEAEYIAIAVVGFIGLVAAAFVLAYFLTMKHRRKGASSSKSSSSSTSSARRRHHNHSRRHRRRPAGERQYRHSRRRGQRAGAEQQLLATDVDAVRNTTMSSMAST